MRAGAGRGGRRADLLRCPRAAQEAARPAPEQKGLTEEQTRLATRLDELQAAADWRGIRGMRVNGNGAIVRRDWRGQVRVAQ